MPDLSRSQIAALTGLSSSTLTRHLAQFPGARSGRGQYDSTDPDFAAWLCLHQGGPTPTEHPVCRPQPGDPTPVDLPSGYPVRRSGFDALRTVDEDMALRVLDQWICRLRWLPHFAVPDLLPFEPLELPSSQVVNANQWRLFRSPRSSETRAGGALDVLLRSFDPELAQ